MVESLAAEPIAAGQVSALEQPKRSKAFNSFRIAQAQFDRVAEYLGLDPATRDLLRFPMREYQFAIPVRMDDGTVKIFRGFRVQGTKRRQPNGSPLAYLRRSR